MAVSYTHLDVYKRQDVRPRATKEIGAMIGMIKTLIEGGHAYAADNGDVYFLSLIHI